jgi:hypothetical protein
MRIVALSLFVAVLCGACAYKADPISAPAHNVVTSYAAKIPGKWLLYVDSASLTANVRPSDMNCVAHTFPLDLTGGFTSSIRVTLANVVEQLEETSNPASNEAARRRGARGVINVRGEEVRGRLRVAPGFWEAKMDTEVQVVAAVMVDGPAGRLYGQTFEGQGRSDAGAGIFCSGGGQSMTESAEKALRDVVRKIAEGLGNADRLRSAARVSDRR